MKRLAVFVPVLGTPSETFVRRHVEELMPDETVVVARRLAEGTADWVSNAPTLLLDPLSDEWGGQRERGAVAAFLHEHGVEAVLLEFLDIWLPFLSTVQQTAARCVAHAHGYDVSSRLRDDYWRSAYRAYVDVDAVVTMSQVSRQRLIDVGIPADRLVVAPYGVDVPAASATPAQAPVHVLLAGRLVAKKHPLATIEACDRAAACGADIRVTVIGDGPLMAQVVAAAKSARPRIDVLGEQGHAEVLAMMRSADIFCQHSVVDPETGDEEGLPVAILEAMAHGLPVVSTRHAGIPEAVTEGVTGYLVDEEDTATMGRHIVALAGDPNLRARLGAAGRERIRANFTWEHESCVLRRTLGLAS